ncbi:hypothetical protein Scep_014695 [Stephania cephalantha]|uniref:Uncharacterized protein n=1 Tax=Stephania cephalantha TaxID=152367 RepID=A0AAP0J1Q9_9MAGN
MDFGVETSIEGHELRGTEGTERGAEIFEVVSDMVRPSVMGGRPSEEMRINGFLRWGEKSTRESKMGHVNERD